MSESAETLEEEVVRLREENKRLSSLLKSVSLKSELLTDPHPPADSNFDSPQIVPIRLHYLYASPLILLDNLGTTVIETFDPLRIHTEFKRIAESIEHSMITVATPANLLNLKYILDKTASRPSPNVIIHISMHTIDLVTGGSANSHSSGPSESNPTSLRCALEDSNGKGYLMSPDDFADSLGGSLNSLRLIFINACKSVEIGLALLRKNKINHVVCLGKDQPVLESTALVFSAEFYLALIKMNCSVGEAFNRGRLAVKLCPNPKVAQQAALFTLLPVDSDNHFTTGVMRDPNEPIDDGGLCERIPVRQPAAGSPFVPCGTLPSNSFYVGHISHEEPPEDFIGRQVEMARICGIMFSNNGRRVCAVTGISGIGKDLFLSETAKYFASPGGRHFSGGICVIRFDRCVCKETIELMFLQQIMPHLKLCIENIKSWYFGNSSNTITLGTGTGGPSRMSSSGSAGTARPRLSSNMSSTDGPIASAVPATTTTNPEDHLDNWSEIRSYKVFWADTFANAVDLRSFLHSYQVELPDDSVTRLFAELRSNGTQLQDWGHGRLVRVVHVIRCLVRTVNSNSTYLLERKVDGELGLLAKKFDPVTENVLEVASMAVKKELGDGIIATRVVLRNRKPNAEIEKSASYPKLTTKYVLYTAEVTVDETSLPGNRFETTESQGAHKVHSWEWINSAHCELLQDILCETNVNVKNLEMQLYPPGVSDAAVTIVASNNTLDSLQKEWNKYVKDWAKLVAAISRQGGTGTIAPSCALVLLQADEYMRQPIVREHLGQALAVHPQLKILFSIDKMEGELGSDHNTSHVHSLTTHSVSYKVVHFPLPALQPIDAAVLFTRRINRPLYKRDFVDFDAPPPLTDEMLSNVTDGAAALDSATSPAAAGNDDNLPLVMSTKSSNGVANLARLARHPVLLKANGVPARILAIAQHVTLDLNSLSEMV